MRRLSGKKLLFPPAPAPGTVENSLSLILLFSGLLALLALAIFFNEINFPYKIGTYFRALYVDEGFYSDAAQNYIKFGAWGLPHDSRHWPGAPLTLILQTVVFSIFGVGVTAARMISVVLSLLGALAFYAIARQRLRPSISVVLTLSAVTTISFTTHAKTAITDPMAMAMALFAMFIYSRFALRRIAIPLSLVFGFLAFFSKIYFLFAFASIVVLWLGEIVAVPLLNREKPQKYLLSIFMLSVGSLALLYFFYQTTFSDALAEYLQINANKRPRLELDYISQMLAKSFAIFPANTKTHVFLFALAFAALLYLLSPRLNPNRRCAGFVELFRNLTRGEWAMSIFLLSGLATIGVLQDHKTHYQYFAILPVAFLATTAVATSLPTRYSTSIALLVLALHSYSQLTWYKDWYELAGTTTISDANYDMAARINAESESDRIAVIGEYSAQLSLYGDRMLSLDAKWTNRKTLCERIAYWRPEYHVNVIWRNSASNRELSMVKSCKPIVGTEEISRYQSFSYVSDQIVLSKILYQ